MIQVQMHHKPEDLIPIVLGQEILSHLIPLTKLPEPEVSTSDLQLPQGTLKAVIGLSKPRPQFQARRSPRGGWWITVPLPKKWVSLETTIPVTLTIE